MYVSISFFAISSSNPYLKICDLTQYFFAYTPMKCFLNLILPPLTALLGHPIQNNFFALIKIFLQTLVEIIFIYKKRVHLEFWDTPRNKRKSFTYDLLCFIYIFQNYTDTENHRNSSTLHC